MSRLLKTLARSANTAVKLPFAMAWDCISLGNMGDGASTSKVLREHQQQKQVDDFVDAIKALREMKE
jgi:hypothetical protein